MNKVWVFFYGTFMSARVLKHHGLCCDETYPAKVSGYSLVIRPRVNLTKKFESNSYGGLAFVKQNELASLYQKAFEAFGHLYSPYPILAEMPDGLFRQSLCFISEEFNTGDPDPLYIDEMIKCAKEMNAPKSYIAHIASFKK